MGERRESKKRETRQRISDVATTLFFAKGFEAVTVEEVANAANVSKMTVFNYFARKEDLMLDREDDLRLVSFCEAVRQRPRGEPPVAALRRLVAELAAQKHWSVCMFPEMADWWRVVHESPSLKARVRELADEAAEAMAVAIAGPKPDGRARLEAGMLVLTVNAARQEGVRVLERGGTAKKATAALLSLMAQGFATVEPLSR